MISVNYDDVLLTAVLGHMEAVGLGGKFFCSSYDYVEKALL